MADIASLVLEVDSRDVKKAEKDLNSFSRTANTTEKSANKLNKGFGSLSHEMKKVSTAIGGLTVVFAAFKFLSDATRITKEFTSAISDLSAITGATGKNLEFLTEASREFGRTTTLSATESAKAFKLIASAKPDLLSNVVALKEVTKEAITLAEAAGTTLPEAANTLGASLNQFNASASESSRFINVMAAGSKFGASSIAELAVALKASGTTASAANISFEETNAAIQSLSTVAIKGEQAGTALRNIILKLQKEGIAKLDPSVVGLSKALGNLAKENRTTTELMTLFGLENVNAAQALIKNADNVSKLTEKLTDTNIAYEQASTKNNNLEGDLKRLNSTYEETALILGDAVNPAIRSGTQLVNSLLASFNKLFETAEQAASRLNLAEVNLELEKLSETMLLSSFSSVEMGLKMAQTSQKGRENVEKYNALLTRQLKLEQSLIPPMDAHVKLFMTLNNETKAGATITASNAKQYKSIITALQDKLHVLDGVTKAELALQYIEKLGTGATKEQINEVYALVGALYDQTEALKDQKKAQKELDDLKDVAKEASKMFLSPVDKINKKFEDIRDTFGDIFSDDQVINFYSSWKKELDDVDKKEKEKVSTLKQTNTMYGAIASSMSGLFEAGSDGAKAMMVAQQALSMVNAVNAILTQGQGDPYSSPARMAAMAITVAGYLSQIGQTVSGGGGGSMSAQESMVQESKFNSKLAEMASQPILDRLDRQIELLEIIGLEGTAGRAKVSQADVQFGADMQQLAETIIQSTQFETIRAGKGSTTQQQIDEEWVGRFAAINKQVGDSLFDLSEDMTAINFDAKVFRENVLTSLNALYKQDLMNVLSNWEEAKEEGARTWEQFHAFAQAQGMQSINDLQEITHEYILTINDVVESMVDAKDTFKDLYDELTGTGFFQERDLARATQEIDTLLAKSGKNLSDYLAQQIAAIEKVEKEFGTKITELFLSQDPEDLEEQIEALDQLNETMDDAFGEGIQDALDYMGSIELVANAMIDANKAAKEMATEIDTLAKDWSTRNYTEEQIAQDFASSLGVTMPQTIAELDSVVTSLIDRFTAVQQPSIADVTIADSPVTTGAIQDVVETISLAGGLITDHDPVEAVEDLVKTLGVSLEDIVAWGLSVEDIINTTMTETAAGIADPIVAIDPEVKRFNNSMAMLQQRLDNLGLDSRQIEMNALATEQEKALLALIHAREDELALIKEQEKELERFNKSMLSLQERFDVLGLDEAQKLAYDRNKELANASTLVEKALLRQIYASEDYYTALDQYNEDLKVFNDYMVQLNIDNLNEELSTTNDYLAEIENNLGTLDSVFDSLNATIDKLRGESVGAEYTLGQFYQAMDKIATVDPRQDAEGYSKAVQDAISKSSILYAEGVFKTSRERLFEQSVAANQFEELADYTKTEVDYLRLIEENTRAQISALVLSIQSLEQSMNSAQVAPSMPVAPLPAAIQRMPSDLLLGMQGISFRPEPLIAQMAPSLNVGSTNIPEDMTANIHAREMIVPETFADGVRKGEVTIGSTNNEDTANILQAILSKLTDQENILEDSRDIQNESVLKLEEIKEIT